MEPASDRLRQTLLDLRLCRPRDLRRCRARVRRLADDLPAFDSVWIDALLQARRLTPFQARLLDESRAADLSVGPCVLLDRLGQGRSASTYVARLREGRQRCVLKLIEAPPEALPATLAKLQELSGQLAPLAHPHAVGPHTALQHGERLVTVSRWVDGLRLSELLVRRGRFAPEIVAEIARQLLRGLAALEHAGVVHGEIRLSNVRLTRAGRVVLVDSGIGPAVRPQLTIHAGLPPDRYDGIAPELVGTGQAPAAASDVYALGCLLWQLLAGRPPFPTGDPLAKLAAHQTRPIEDVREWAPDTPGWLADTIRRFTAGNPSERPQTFRAGGELLGAGRRAGPARLRRFRAEFSRSVPRHSAEATADRRWKLTAALLVGLGGTALAVVDQGVRGEVLAMLPQPMRRILHENVTGTGDTKPGPQRTLNGQDQPLQPLPAPDPRGVVRLDAPGSFQLAPASGTRTPGAGRIGSPAWERLVIRADGRVPAVLVVGHDPAILTAGHVVLENVIIRRSARASAAGDYRAGGAPPLLAVHSQGLEISRCWFEADVPDQPASQRGAEYDATPPAASGLIAWQPLDVQDPFGGRLAISDTVFAGPTAALQLTSAPARIDVINSLHLGRGPLLAMQSEPRAGRALRIRLDRVTLRGGEALVSWRLSDLGNADGAITIDATDCVFDLSGPKAALFHLVGESVAARRLEAIALTGDGSLAAPGTAEIALVAPTGGAFRRLDRDAIRVEGLTTAPFEFAGRATPRPTDSAVRPDSIGGPRLSAGTPGIDPAKLLRPDLGEVSGEW